MVDVGTPLRRKFSRNVERFAHNKELDMAESLCIMLLDSWGYYFSTMRKYFWLPPCECHAEPSAWFHFIFVHLLFCIRFQRAFVFLHVWSYGFRGLVVILECHCSFRKTVESKFHGLFLYMYGFICEASLPPLSLLFASSAWWTFSQLSDPLLKPLGERSTAESVSSFLRRHRPAQSYHEWILLRLLCLCEQFEIAVSLSAFSHYCISMMTV